MKSMIKSSYVNEKWDKPQMVRYSPIKLDPKAKILHYSQGVFEGIKAYPSDKETFYLFRAEEHYTRFISSCERLAIPPTPKKYFIDSVEKIVSRCRVKDKPLYIRPFIIATENDLNPFCSNKFSFYVIAESVDLYFKDSIKVIVANLMRSHKGGTGDIKTGGNYSACMLAEKGARDLGYDMVLWLDENKNIEEMSGMNIFCVSENKIYTPESPTILKGITRDSVIKIAERHGIQVIQDKFNLSFLNKADEAFATGTMCGVVPIEQINKVDLINGPITRMICQELDNIKRGVGDVFNWSKEIKVRNKN